MDFFIEMQISAKSLKNIKRQRAAADSESDDRHRRKCKKRDFPHNRRRAEKKLNGEKRNMWREIVLIFFFQV